MTVGGRRDWNDVVVYQVYPATFQEDSSRQQTGTGSIRGITERLPYLDDLGIGAIWISPFYVSPFRDGGYDVADYKAVDEQFGSVDDIQELISEAHKRGIKIMIDFIPNHTSDEHPWFIESQQSTDNPKADWYIWHDGAVDDRGVPLYDDVGNRLPPNNWASVFSLPQVEARENGDMPWLNEDDLTPPISSWRWDDTREQFYLASFARFQPDLNWENEEVQSALTEVMRYWLDMGIDGFRIDAVNYIAKNPALTNEEYDSAYREGAGMNPYDQLIRHESCGYAGKFHDRLRVLINVLKEPRYSHRNLRIIFEAYMEEDELHAINMLEPDYASTFNFGAIDLDWKSDNTTARNLQLRAHYGNLPRGAIGNQVLGNHDKPRVASRYGIKESRAAAVYTLMMPGNIFVYNGEELGLTDHAGIPDAMRKDPNGFRDPNRSPMLWDSERANDGFSAAHPELLYLPLNHMDAGKQMTLQHKDMDSHLELYRSILVLRNQIQPRVLVPLDVFSNDDPLSGWDDAVIGYGVIGVDGDESIVLTNFSYDTREVGIVKFHHRFGNIRLSSCANREYREIAIDEGVSLMPLESIVLTNLR